MHKALFDKASGYYRTKNPLGKDSDFITAPEISQTFGELIAIYILQISAQKKSPISFVEMGAGKGTLFFDILHSIKKLAQKNVAPALNFIERADMHIIEINPVLKKVQQEKLKDFTIKWHENFADFLAQRNGEIFFISNELFDCFAIDQYVKTDIGWCERLVDSDKFVTANFDPEIHQFVQNLVQIDAPFGAVFEHSQSARNFMMQLCEAIKSNGGVAINFDYGYFRSEFANTLQAIKNHQKTNVLENVGESDITAHVDFTALDNIAKNYGLNSSLITQREFLISLGIEERRKMLKNENSAIDRLIASDQMGELFKCHIIWKNS